MHATHDAMINLFFVRGEMLTDITYHVEDKTEVSVYGDVPGFEYFQTCLRRAKTAKTNIHLARLNFRTHSMRCTVLRANHSIGRKKLKFLERLTFWNRKPRMEFVIYGTPRGYDYLITLLQSSVDASTNDVDEHIHLDDLYSPVLAKRSINLRITDPLTEWEKSRVPSHVWQEIYREPSDSYLPSHSLHRFDLEHPERYLELDPRKDPYLFSLR